MNDDVEVDTQKSFINKKTKKNINIFIWQAWTIINFF